MIKGGCTFWARQTFDSDIFYNKPDKWFKIWFFIVSRVNYKDNSTFKRGENLVTYYEIIERTKATKDQIYKAIKYFKTERMIDANKTTRGFIIKVLNYGIYQDIENYQDDSKTTARRQQDDTITKEGKEIKNKYISTYINYFNEKFKTSYQVTSERVKKLTIRLKMFTLEEILKALDNLSKSEFHQGDNDRGWKADPDFLIRNDEQIDKWLNTDLIKKDSSNINNLLKGSKNYEDFKRGL